MCEPNFAHDDARQEYAKIVSSAKRWPKAVTTAAWLKAHVICATRNFDPSTRGKQCPKGDLYVIEESVGFFNRIRANVVIARYRNGACVDRFACDVSGSPWLFGSDPQDRAIGRIT